MNRVEEDIKYLIELVKKDVLINDIRDFIRINPRRIAEIDSKIAAIENQIKEKEEILDSREKELRHLKGVIDAENDKLKKKRFEEKDIKTNEAYRAWEHDIGYLRSHIEEHEEKMLEVMEIIDRVKSEISEITGKVESDKQALLDEKRELEEEIKAKQEELEILEDEKVRVLPHISESIRRQYERIHRAKNGLGVANLIGDVCQGCFSRIPPQKAHEVRKNDRIIKCEFCGRILVYFPIEGDLE